MTIHKEGYKILIVLFIISAGLGTGAYFIFNTKPLVCGLSIFALAILYFIVLFFFRSPDREVSENNNFIMAPADGKVVVIEETMENEYFKDSRIQVSIFMSPFDVHVNWCPFSGEVKYKKYHEGCYMVAYNPKSSDENERSSIVIQNSSAEILVRQVAGILARRIVTYPEVSDAVVQGNELGFIKFGSRVDLFLPLNTKLNVNLNQKVRGNKTIIGQLA